MKLNHQGYGRTPLTAMSNTIDTEAAAYLVQARKNNLLSGELDEAAEHEHFVKRLMNGEMEELPTARNNPSSSSGIGYSPNDQKGLKISPQLKQRHEKNVKHAPATTASGQTGGRFLRGG